MTRGPRIETRPEQHYVGTGAVMAMRDFQREIPAMTARVLAWLDGRGLQPGGRPFLRYRVIDMPEHMDVELGVPVHQAVPADDSIRSHLLPAGRYAALAYTGGQNGVSANQQLVDWIAEQGEQADSHAAERGQAFTARYETFLSDADDEPDQGRWEIEVAILLRAG